MRKLPIQVRDPILRRRGFLGGLGALAVAPSGFAKTAAPPPISLVAINHTKIRVPDPARSLAWYQSLFGLPIVARQGTTVILRIGEGPQFLAIDGKPSDKPGGVYVGLGVDGFDANQVLQGLQAHKELAQSDRIVWDIPGATPARFEGRREPVARKIVPPSTGADRFDITAR